MTGPFVDHPWRGFAGAAVVGESATTPDDPWSHPLHLFYLGRTAPHAYHLYKRPNGRRLHANDASLGNSTMAGYSGTPLAKKLGIKAGTVLQTVNAPPNYAALLGPLPENVTIAPRRAKELDLVHVFTTTRSELIRSLGVFLSQIKQNGAIWVSWPKKASGIPSEITEDTVREVALPLGLVDIKVCAIDEVWSGLKLVIRKANRKARRRAEEQGSR